jgi:hypothetical protein
VDGCSWKARGDVASVWLFITCLENLIILKILECSFLPKGQHSLFLFKSICIFSSTMPSGESGAAESQIPTSYGCTLCNRHFTSSGGLVRHKKAIHPTPSSLPEDSTKYVHVRQNISLVSPHFF